MLTLKRYTLKDVENVVVEKASDEARGKEEEDAATLSALTET